MGRVVTGMRLGVLGLCLAAIAACSPVYRNHGYVPRDEDLALVSVGVDTRDSVGNKVGRPSSSGVLSGAAWYYVGSRWKHVGLRAPQEIERQVVAVSFDDNDRVENVERFGLEKGQVVALSRRVTDSNIKGVGFIRQLLGNIGRFNAADALQ